MENKNKEHFHFIAIGGIGMSGLATYLLEKGYSVSGSDIENSKYISDLKKLNAQIFIGHKKENIPPNDNVIIIASSAINENNVELIEAKKRNLKIYHRSDLLKFISEDFQKNDTNKFIGFCGTHGKTTTSGLCSYVLEKAKYNPALVVGGIVPEIKINAKYSNGNYFVAELDESDGTIVKYTPDITVINNLEVDHTDYYKNGIKSLYETFNKFLENLKKESIVITNADCANLENLKKQYNKINVSFKTFGIDNNANYMARNIEYKNLASKFDFYIDNKYIGEIELDIPGKFNVYNALAVLGALMENNVGFEEIKPFFKTFRGMGRRFEKVTQFNNIKIYDDYAHHPTEIKSTLGSIKHIENRKIVIFQPHRYSRLKEFFSDFIEGFVNSNIDLLFVLDVYAACEKKDSEINSEIFVKHLQNAGFKNAIYVRGKIEDASIQIVKYLKENDFVISFGAGDVTKIGKLIEENYKQKV